MRTIQKLSIYAFDETGDKLITEAIIKLPKHSQILGASFFGADFIVWFSGYTEEHINFEDRHVGFFKAEDPLPNSRLRFHSLVNADNRLATHPIFFFEFSI